MKMDFCDGMVFSNYRGVILPPIQFGDVKLYQIGENLLEMGSEIYEHIQLCNEISYVVSGEADFYADGVKHHLTKGSVHVIPKGINHRIAVNNSSRFRYFYLGFDLVSHEEPSPIDKLSEFYEGEAKVYTDDGTLMSYFGHFVNELNTNDMFNYDMYYSFIKLILVHIYRQYSHDKEKTRNINIVDDDMNSTVFNILKYIDSNIVSISRVSDVAVKLGYSSSYMSRIFRHKMGITISEYIGRKKIECAMELLKDKRLSINEVTEHLNFDSYRSFLMMFKKYVGCPPSEFIKLKSNE